MNPLWTQSANQIYPLTIKVPQRKNTGVKYTKMVSNWLVLIHETFSQCRYNVGHSLRRWPNMVSILGERLVFAGFSQTRLCVRHSLIIFESVGNIEYDEYNYVVQNQRTVSAHFYT